MSKPHQLETFTDSAVYNAGPAVFQGLWIHFINNPEGSLYNFLYGKSGRSYEIEVGGEDLVFAGREFGITEFGEHRSDNFDVSVTVPHGPNYYSEREALRNFILTKSPMMVRDNRGVVVYGTASGLTEEHEDHGSDFSFVINRVHREQFFTR